MPRPSSRTSTDSAPGSRSSRDRAARRPGVLHDVGERLGDDPVRRHLDRRGQPGHAVGGHAHVERRAHPLGLLLQCRLEAEVVERRRAQVVDQAPYVVQRLAHLGAGQPDQLARPLGVRLDRVAGRVEPHRHAPERRPEPVVQVAADPPPVVLPAEHQPLPALLHLGGEQAAAHRDRRLPDQVDQQPLVAPRQHRAHARRRQHQPADARRCRRCRSRCTCRAGRRGSAERVPPSGCRARPARSRTLNVDATAPASAGSCSSTERGLLEPGRERRHHVVPVAAPPEQHPAYGGADPVRSGP